MHRHQWLAAIAELEADGLETTPCPSTFPQPLEKTDVAYQLWNQSTGTESQGGRWAQGRSVDGRGDVQYVANPQPLFGEPVMVPVPPRLHGTGKQPVPPSPACPSRVTATSSTRSRRPCRRRG